MLRNAIQRLAPGSSLGYSQPPKGWFDFALQETMYTKDIAVLEQHSWQLYFACDETQLGHVKQSLLGQNEYKCPGFTQRAYNYWDGGPVFGAVPLEAEEGYHNTMPNYPDVAKIKGQLLLIRPQAFLGLDSWKENGVQYTRAKVRIIVPFRSLRYIHDKNIPDPEIEYISESGHIGRTYEKVCTVRAWMYIGVPEFWDKLISNYDWGSVPTFQARNRNWCRTYYQVRRPNPPTK